MTPEGFAQLKIDEGFRADAYPDPLSPMAKAIRLPPAKRARGWERLSGHPWTIGYGHTGLDVHPGLRWTKAQGEAALLHDVAEHEALLDKGIPWWRKLDPVRQDVLSNMVFNMGWDDPRTPRFEGLSGFQNTLAAVKVGNYRIAATNMRVSMWAGQVGVRARRLAAMMETGNRV